MTNHISQTGPYNANRWGITRATVENGRIVSLSPIAEDAAPSPLLDRLAALPFNPQRIRRPAVRRGYLTAGSASREGRGADDFVEVDWDTALTLAAKALRETYDQYGPQSVWGHAYGWMNTGHVQGARPLLHRLLNSLGGFIPLKNSYSNAAISIIQTHIVGDRDPRSTDWESVLEHSERILFWGADPVRTNDVDWFTSLHQSRTHTLSLKNRPDIKTYSVNPIVTDTALEVGSENIRPFPGTDAAILSAMIYVLIEEKLADWQFVHTYTVGADELADDILGKNDGTPKTPEWAEKISGVPAETIRTLTRDIATHRTMIMMGWGPQRLENGEQTPWLGWALAAFLGQIGLPGGGIGTNYHYNQGGIAPTPRGAILKGIPTDPLGKARARFTAGLQPLPVARVADALLEPGKTIDFDGVKVTYPEVHLVFWTGGNPFTHHPDTNRLARAFKKPDTVIVSDINWTATARHADIVLPACTNFEMGDITRIGGRSNDGIVFTEAVLPIQGESRTNYEIFRGLAAKLGLEDVFTEGLSAEGWRERLYNEARADSVIRGAELPPYEEARKKGLILFERAQDTKGYTPFVALGDFRKAPDEHPLNTLSGKIELASEKIRGFNYADVAPYPRFVPPTEGAGKTTEAFPFVLLSSKSARRLHSQLDSSLTEKYGAEPCHINPVDAAKLGIAHGDTVVVKSARGQTLLATNVTDRVRPGVVAVDNGSWYIPKNDPQLGLLDTHGAANTLTRDIPTSNLAQGNVSSGASVSVAKYTGPYSPAEPVELPRGIH